MSNPFDQFAMPAAPPPVAPPQPSYGAYPSDPSMMAAPQPTGSFGGPSPYGAPAPTAYGQNPYGAPPLQQQPPAASDPFAGYGQVAPPPAAPAGYPGMEQQQQAPPPPQPQQQQQPPPTENANPFGGAQEMHSAAQPPAADPGNPFGGVPPTGAAVAGPPTAPPPTPSDPWGAPPQPAGPPEPQTSYGGGPPPAQPYGAPPQPYGAPEPPSQQPPQPYGAPPYGNPPQQQQQQPSADAGALVVSQTQSNPYAQQQPPNPYDQSYGQPAYGQPPAYGQAYPPAPPPPAVDPFSVFESSSSQQALVVAPTPAAADPASSAPPAVPAAASDDDFWGSFGSNNVQTGADASKATPSSTVHEEKKGEDGLPAGGEWYDAKIFTPTLGVMFFKPQELTDSLFLNTDRSIVDALGERPVVAFIVEGSSARSAGVELGHVLLKVNGVDVKTPKDASRLIKEGPRPLPLLFYVPNTDVVVAEGEHMVKYDTRDTTAPNSAKDWKPKYVVIGGIIAQPWMMNMYRSKSEYDIAVIETQARRPVSVKVKQFSLQGARIQNDWQGPQMVKYKNKLQPWKYIVVLPVGRNPIKISSPNLAQLKPVHEGIRRVLLAQQRERGSRQQHHHGGHDNGGYHGHQQQDYPQPHQQQSYRY